MLEEMRSIEANGTWKLVDPPPRQRPIGLKWVFKTKRDAAGNVTKHKARLVSDLVNLAFFQKSYAVITCAKEQGYYLEA